MSNEKFFVGAYSFYLVPLYFLKLIIMKECCQIWANIFLGIVPFVCWSKVLLKIFDFSWSLKTFVFLSFCMFGPSTYWFWEILCFSWKSLHVGEINSCFNNHKRQNVPAWDKKFAACNVPKCHFHHKPLNSSVILIVWILNSKSH